MRRYDKNILLEARQKRIAKLPLRIQEELKEYHLKTKMTDELLIIKRKRPKLEKGDVFVVQPKEGLYFYGRILKSNVNVLFKGGPTYAWEDVVI